MSSNYDRHDEDLSWYFSGGASGDCGLRSSMGGQLEAIAAASQSDERRRPEWDGRTRYTATGLVPMPDQVVICRQSRSGASPDSTEAAASALSAVRRERIIRAALSGLHHVELRVLAEYYVPRPESSHTGLDALGQIRGVVAYLADDARELAAMVTAKKTAATAQARATAKARLGQYVTQARALVARARSSYSVAEHLAVRVERERRARRFAGGTA